MQKRIDKDKKEIYNGFIRTKQNAKMGSRNFVVDATFLYLVASTLNGIQNAFKWNTVISDFW